MPNLAPATARRLSAMDTRTEKRQAVFLRQPRRVKQMDHLHTKKGEKSRP